MTKAAERRSGVTLIELVAAIAVLGISVPPLLFLFREASAGSVGAAREETAAQLASALLEEIVSKAFTDPDGGATFGPEEGSRAAFDDVDDYRGFVDAPPSDASGTPLLGFGAFERRAEVEPVALGPSGWGPSGSPTGFVAIRVDVAAVAEPAVVLARLETLRTAAVPGGSGGGPALEFPPLDPHVAEISAVATGNREFEVLLYNPGPDDLVLDAFALDGVPSGDRLRELQLDGRRIWRAVGVVTTPTGVLSLNAGTEARRTVSALEYLWLTVRFGSSPSGTTDYTLDLFGTLGEQARLEFPIGW